MNCNCPDELRKRVSEAYSKAVSSPSGGSCCSGQVQKGVAAQFAGYSREELEALPAEAVANSFGCGNPLAFVELKEGDVVLDLGSGAGIDILIAGKKVGPTGRVIGVDMTDEMIVRARKNISASGLTNVEVRKGLIEDLPVESSSVDWVISNCVINLSPEKSRVFAEIARVLKPGGRMLVSDIVAEHLPDWVRQSEALYSSCVAGAISEEEYLEGLRRAGLVNAEVRERIVYDAVQLGAFVQSELQGSERVPACCSCGGLDPETVRRVVESLVGKIWSTKFFAEKPVM